MPKDPQKVLQFIVDKVEVGESAAGAEPAVYTDVGLVDDEKLTVKLVPNKRRELGGESIQQSYDASFETSLMQVLDIATIEGFRNKTCWIKATDKAGAIIRVRNFRLNVEIDLQVHAKGNSAIMLSGTRYARSASDVYTYTAGV